MRATRQDCRTTCRVSKGSSIFASLTTTGQTVNSDTGAPLFIGTGGLGVQAGLFQFKAFTASASTVLDRDRFSVSLQVSQTTTIAAPPSNAITPFNIPAPAVGSTSQGETVYATWTHQIREDLTLGSAAAFSKSRTSGSGDEQSWAVSVGAQYLLSETLAATASYSFFDRLASTQTQSTQGQSFYQNLVLVGLNKQF